MLKGKKELTSRLKAIRLAFKPIGREWADRTVAAARPQVPAVTGKTRRSLRRRHSSQKRATVYGSFVAGILDKGAKPHTILAKKAPALVFQAGGKTIFARKVHHRGVRGSGYAKRAAAEGMRKTPAAELIIAEWNRAA